MSTRPSTAANRPADYVERTAREKAAFGLKVLSMRSMVYRPVLGRRYRRHRRRRSAGQAGQRRRGRRVHAPARRSHARGAHRHRAGHPRAAAQSAISVSTVTFRELDDAEIKRYCATPEPYDKAGGYGIQGLAAIFIERIEGSYTGVMGLPLFETARLLSQAGIRVL